MLEDRRAALPVTDLPLEMANWHLKQNPTGVLIGFITSSEFQNSVQDFDI
jgi:hypothetical protein